MRDYESTDLAGAAHLAREDAPRGRPRYRACRCYVDPVSGPEICASCERAAEEGEER